jgi:hypothetical protein
VCKIIKEVRIYGRDINIGDIMSKFPNLKTVTPSNVDIGMQKMINSIVMCVVDLDIKILGCGDIIHNDQYMQPDDQRMIYLNSKYDIDIQIPSYYDETCIKCRIKK